MPHRVSRVVNRNKKPAEAGFRASLGTTRSATVEACGTRLPVSVATALAMAGITSGTPTSPRPPGAALLLCTKVMSIAGTSLMRSMGRCRSCAVPGDHPWVIAFFMPLEKAEQDARLNLRIAPGRMHDDAAIDHRGDLVHLRYAVHHRHFGYQR